MLMKVSLSLAVLWLYSVSVMGQESDVPAPKKADENTVMQVFKESFSQSLMFFKPAEFPLGVEKGDKKQIKQMKPWLKLGLITKSKKRVRVEKIYKGKPRIMEVNGYLYELNQENPWVSDKGFYYGRPSMQALLSVSEPQYVSTDFFSEAYITWHVVDQPDWVKKVDKRPRTHRPLKRAMQSKKQPFEKRIYIIYRDNKWRLWVEKGDQSLF